MTGKPTRRFGGRYSPGTPQAAPGAAPNAAPAHPFEGRRRSRAGGRVNALFLLPFPFVFSAFVSDPAGLALNLMAFGALMAAAWMTREGVLAQAAYDARRVARRPAIPRKSFGSALTGIGLALAGLADGSVLNGIVFGLLGLGLHAMAFGLDPWRSKGADSADRMQSDRVARAVDEAERHLAAMKAAIARTGDRAMQERVERFAATARQMFRTVEGDPRDLAAARKFLGVYLLGARDATVKFADLAAGPGGRREAGARRDYTALLDDLEANFAAKTETLLLDDRTDLDVEIGVLRDRLDRERLTASD